ncbi:hypothetical protein [Sphingopyxis sp. PET50]|uniref:hypothetical protein n=1 Tax=Sphingopyxis sp. PET50 TaxID=2976533 RepID=UPI0021B0016D|nr:hypothetical protein [Sphingopyxis sp. PET50]
MGILTAAMATAAMATAAMATAAAAAPPPAAGKLPIEKGVWIDAGDVCSTATFVTVYDGVGYGSIGFDGAGPTGGLQTILRTAAGKNGYTNAWFDDNTSVDGDLSVKSLGPGSFMTRFVSYGSGYIGGRVEVSESRFKKCDFAVLPARTQELVRQRAPLAAPTVAPEAAQPAALPAPVAPFNIRPGHYVPVAAPCSSASEMIFYFDGRRYGWIDLDPFNPNAMDPVSGLKKRGAVWDTGFGATIRVDGVERVFASDDIAGDESLRWCPASQVRSSARVR